MIRSLAVAMTLALVSAPVFAQDNPSSNATASVVKGTAQINKGNGFVPLRPGQKLEAGDRVMVLDDSSATLTFSDGCTLEVEEETIVVVPEKSTCAGGVVTVQTTSPGSSAAVGSRAAGGVDWKGFWTVASVVIIGDAILLAEDDGDTVSP